MTLKNFGIFMIVVVVAFIGISVGSELGGKQGSDFGRLVSREMPQETTAIAAPAPVAEAPVPDQTGADPMLVAPAAREQYLGDTTATQAPVVPVPVPARVSPAVQASVDRGNVAIVGDGTSVAVVSPTKTPAHKLGGGIFRQ